MLWSYGVLLLILLVVGALVCAFTVFMMARFLLMPPRMAGGLAIWTLRRLGPRDLGLSYDDVWFVVRDEATGGRETLRLGGWWMSAMEGGRGSDRCIIIVHGYADSKIGAIAWAPTFLEMGWNVLVFDQRAHGEAPGRYTTAGYFERHDLSQVIDQIRATRPGQTRRLVLFGVSLGAAVAGGALELRQKERGRGECACDVEALIMDCPYRDYVGAAHTHARVMGMPGPWFARAAVALAKRMSGADFYVCSPVDVIPRLRCPLMVIHGAEDLFIDPEHMDAVEAATRARAGRWAELGPTEYWRVERTHHVLAIASDPRIFRQRLEDFLALAAAWRAECEGKRETSRDGGVVASAFKESVPAQEISP